MLQVQTRRLAHLVLVSLTAVLISGCQVHSDHGGINNEQRPTTPTELTTEVIAHDLLTNGRRVMVVFGDFAVAGGTATCPVKVRSVDDVCATNDYQNTDPSVVCRVAKDTAGNPSLSNITWRSDIDRNPDANVNFSVEFENGYLPCGGSWTGRKPQASHTCKLRTGAELQIGGAHRIYVKYTIVGENPACPPLDPYFIVRH